MSNKQLCFIALLPPPEVQAEANAIKAHFAEAYQSFHAQKSPPHITLKAPFKWAIEQLPNLKTTLEEFSQNQSAVPVTLSGFGAFPPRVIYVHVEKTPDLLAMEKALLSNLENKLGLIDRVAKSRSFVPHMTVAFRDFSKSNFRKAWAIYLKCYERTPTITTLGV